MCVLRLGFRLRPATPGWGVGVCVFVCALCLYPATPGSGVWCGCVCLGLGLGCARPLLAAVCGVVLCAWARVSAAPRHSWLGCWGVCVLVCALCLYPATPGWGVRLGCVCLGSGFGCAPPLLAGVLGFCVCLCAPSACRPPPLAGVCGAGVRVGARVLAAPRHSRLGCRGVSVPVCAPPLAPRHSWPGFVVCGFAVPVRWFVACCARCPGLRHPVAVVAWHLSVCLGSGRRRASLACPVAPCGAPRLLQSGRSRCSGRLPQRRGAFPHPGGLRLRLYWVAARGTQMPAENRAHCACRWPRPRQGRWARSALYPFGAPRSGCPPRVPPASVLGCVGCCGLRVWTRSLTRPVSCTVRRSTEDPAGEPGLFLVDVPPLLARQRTPRPGPVRVRVCSSFVAESGGLASRAHSGAPHLFLWLLCLSALPGPLRAGVARLVVLWLPPPPPPLFFCAVPFSARPPCLLLFLASGPGCLWPWRLVCPSSLPGSSPPPLAFFFLFSFSFLIPPPPPLFFVALCFAAALCSASFFFLCCCAPPLSLASSGFRPRVPWAMALCAVCFVGLPLLGSPCAFALFVVPPLPLAAPWWFLPPPPFFVSRCFSRCRFVLRFFFLSRCAPPLSLASSGFRPRVPWAMALCADCFVGLPLLGSPCAFALFVVPALPFAAPWWFLPPPPFFVSRCFSRCRFELRFFFFLVARPCCLWLSLVSGPGCPGPWRCVLFVFLASSSSPLCALTPLLWFPPGRLLLLGGCCFAPLPFVSRCFFRCCFVLRCVFLSRCAPPLPLAFSGFRPRVPWALALCAVCSVGLPLLGSPCAPASFVVPAWPSAAPWCLLPPPPLFCLAVFLSFALCSVFFLSRCAPPLSLAFSGFWPRVPWALALCAVCFVGLPLLGSLCALASFVVPSWPLAAPWWLLPPPPPLCVALFFSPPLCALFFFSFFGARPRCLWLSLVSGPGCPGPWRCVLFVLLASCSSALRALLPLLCFLPGRWLLPGVCCPPPPWCLVVFVAAARCSVFFLSVVLAAYSPPPLVCAWCLVLSGVAALRCPSVLRAVLWCLALLCCGLLRAVWCLFGCLFLCCGVLLVAAACCAVSLVVPSGWVVRGVA